MDIEQGNKLIAEFMGWQHHEDAEYDKYEMANLKYHSSWDWLMPVVEKIDSILFGETTIEGRWCSIKTPYKSISNRGETKIEAVWKSVVEYLEKRQ